MSGVNLSSQSVSQDYDQSSKTDYQQEWSESPFLTGRKVRGWFDDSGELYIQDTTDLNVEEGYLMEYRDGRFGGEVLPYGGFDELDDAMEYAEIILKGKIEVDELLE